MYRLAVLVLDLAGGDFLERDREVVLGAGVDHRGRELVERPLAEVVVVGVDLAGPLGRDENGGVVGVDVLEEAVDARRDHHYRVAVVRRTTCRWLCGLGSGVAEARAPLRRYPPATASRTIAASSSTASSRRSLTTTWANSSCAAS